MVDRLVSVDSTTKQLPTSVRDVIAANLTNPSAPEGAALSATIGTEIEAGAPIPSWRRPTQPQTRMVQGTQSGHAWTLTGADVGSGADTTDYMLGSQSLKIITSAGSVNIDYSLGVSSFSMTNNGLLLYVKFEDVTAVASLVAYVNTTGFGVDYVGGNILNGAAYSEELQYLKSGQWTRFFIPYAKLTEVAGGTFDRTTVRRVRLVLTTRAGRTTRMWLNGVATYDQRVGRPSGTNPRVAFTFDDSDVSQWTKAKPILDKYGYTATWFPIQSILGTAGKMTVAQLQALRAAGHEIGCHAGTAHTSIDTLTQAQRIATFREQRAFMLDNGLGQPESYAYPNGTFTAAAIADVERFFASARTIYPFAFSESTAVPDPYRVRAVPLTASLSLASAQAIIDKTEEFTVFVVHDVVDSGATGNQILTATLASLVDYIATKSVDVVPFGAAVAGR